MIEVRNLTKRYGKRKAIDSLAFSISKGGVIGLLGPNGAGKSTTMNILTGCIAMSEGEVFIEGKNILEEAEDVKRGIGYLPETPPLYSELTVDEHLRFVCGLKKIPRSATRAEVGRVCDLADIADVRGRLISNLSKGYKQRVGLAQALIGDPSLLVLDEPTVGLDPRQILDIRELVRSLSADRTVILSSHILSEVQAICSRVMIINRGKIIADDAPENLNRKLSGAGQLRLTVKGDPEKIRLVLRRESMLKRVRCTESEEAGCHQVEIEGSADSDIRETVFYALAKSDLPILRMGPIDFSLEEIFLDITENTKERGV